MFASAVNDWRMQKKKRLTVVCLRVERWQTWLVKRQNETGDGASWPERSCHRDFLKLYLAHSLLKFLRSLSLSCGFIKWSVEWLIYFYSGENPTYTLCQCSWVSQTHTFLPRSRFLLTIIYRQRGKLEFSFEYLKKWQSEMCGIHVMIILIILFF